MELTNALKVAEVDQVTRLNEVDWSFPDSRKGRSIHSIHPYPAKFIPEIPRELIRTLGVPTGTAVFDPFCGSGVTLVEAQHAGRPAIGIDLNPIACLISRVKTRALPSGFLSSSQAALSHASASSSTDLPDIPNLDHWFNAEVQQAVARLREGINVVADDDSALHDALSLSLSSILVRVSNQDSDTRYAAVPSHYDHEGVLKAFRDSAERMSATLSSSLFSLPASQVVCSDILEITPSDIKVPVGLVVTSPPYPNAYEYWLYHKYRMFWLGYDPIAVRRSEIGARAHYFKKDPPTTEDFKRQLRHVLDLSFAALCRGGHACIVIGRSKIHGEIIENHRLVQEAGRLAGFELTATLERPIARSRKSFNLSHARIKKEHIVILRKA